MIHILTNTAQINDCWAKKHLHSFLKPGMKAVILAMSDFADVHDQITWEKNYGSGGTWHDAYEKPLKSYGIQDVVWISPYKNTRAEMLQAISRGDLVILPGGAPERLMANLKRFGLKKAVKEAPILFGISAGAMAQLADYHITPDDDYPDFGWYKGLGLLPFDVECHYHATRHQKAHVQRAMQEKGLPTYCLYEDGGLLVQDGKVTCMGHVDLAGPWDNEG